MTEHPPKRSKLLTWIALGAVIAALVAAYLFLRANGYLDMFDSVEALQAYVDSFGAWAPIVFIVLQLIQVIIAPIPGNVTTLAGGAMFGFWQAMLYSIIAVFLGSMAAFGIGRKCGKPVIYRLANREVVDKYLVVLAKKQRLTLSLLFLFPFFPDDMLCMVAGLTGYSWKWFAGMLLLTRPWGLIFSALIGSGTIRMPFWGWALLVACAIVCMFLSVRFGSQIEEYLLRKIQKSSI